MVCLGQGWYPKGMHKNAWYLKGFLHKEDNRNDFCLNCDTVWCLEVYTLLRVSWQSLAQLGSVATGFPFHRRTRL